MALVVRIVSPMHEIYSGGVVTISRVRTTMATMSVTDDSLDSAGDGTTHRSMLAAPGLVDSGVLVVGILAESGSGVGDSLVVLVVFVHLRGAWVPRDIKLLNNLGGSLGDNVTAMTVMAMVMVRELISKDGPSDSTDNAGGKTDMAGMATTAVNMFIMAVTVDKTAMATTVGVLVMAVAREFVSENSSSDGTDNTRSRTDMVTAVAMFIMALTRELMSKGSPSKGADKTTMAAMTAAVGVLIMAVARELVSSPGDSTDNTRDKATVVVAVAVTVFVMAVA